MSDVESSERSSCVRTKGAIALRLGLIMFLGILGYMALSAPMGPLDLAKSEVVFVASKIRALFAGLDDPGRFADCQYADFFSIVAYSVVLSFPARSLSRLFGQSRQGRYRSFSLGRLRRWFAFLGVRDWPSIVLTLVTLEVAVSC